MFEYIPGFNNLSDIEYIDYRNQEEREFMTVLNNHASEWKRYGVEGEDLFMFYHDDVLSLGIYIYSFRSLRIDFTETYLLMGNDETGQYVTRLDANNPQVKAYQKADYTTTQLAEIAANWITYELSRKIEVREWVTSSFHHRRWVMVDTNQVISWSDTKNRWRGELGRPNHTAIVYPVKREIFSDKDK